MCTGRKWDSSRTSEVASSDAPPAMGVSTSRVVGVGARRVEARGRRFIRSCCCAPACRMPETEPCLSLF